MLLRTESKNCTDQRTQIGYDTLPVTGTTKPEHPTSGFFYLKPQDAWTFGSAGCWLRGYPFGSESASSHLVLTWLVASRLP